MPQRLCPTCGLPRARPRRKPQSVADSYRYIHAGFCPCVFQESELPIWATPQFSLIDGKAPPTLHTPPTPRDLEALVHFNYRGYMELAGWCLRALSAMAPLVNPAHGNLTLHDREQLVQGITGCQQRLEVLMRVHVQTFGMLVNAVPHENMRRGGKEGGKQPNPEKAARDEKIRQQALAIYKDHRHLTRNAIAKHLHKDYPELSIKQISRIITPVIPPHATSKR